MKGTLAEDPTGAGLAGTSTGRIIRLGADTETDCIGAGEYFALLAQMLSFYSSVDA